VNGCDSIVTTNLTVNTVDTAVSVTNATFTAHATNATYQWINCNTGNTPIAGQTNQSYTVTASGNYAVVVTTNSCSDTSVCQTITTTGIAENSIADAINIYPNPTNGQFTIELGAMLKSPIGNGTGMSQHDVTIKITDELGKEVITINFTGKQLLIEKGVMKAGVYFLQMQTEHGLISKKLIIN
jgi:hypothetical protein